MSIATRMSAKQPDSRTRSRNHQTSLRRPPGELAGKMTPGVAPSSGLLALQRFAARPPIGELTTETGGALQRKPLAGLLELQQLINRRSPIQPAELVRTTPNPQAHGAAAAMQTSVVQRYQQGEEGHGTQTEEQLRQAGLGEDGGTQNSGFIGQVYFGNWLRDFSQVGSTRSPALLRLLNVIAIGEFGNPLDPDDLGAYLPSEHADNPRDGNSAEDPLRPADRSPDGAERISPAQAAAIKEEETPEFKEMIRKRAQDSHLPEYIEVAKAFVRREFARAAKEDKNAKGALALGSGLHAVQDYFSHSNFTDACLALLVAEGAVPPNVHPYVGLLHRARRLNYDPTGGILRGEKRPEIFSGTYRSEGNKAISILETLVGEVKNGSLRRAVIVGSIRLGIQNGGELGGRAVSLVGRALGGPLIALGGGLVEGAKGAYEGVKQGYQLGRLSGPQEAAAAAVGLGVYRGLQGVGRGLNRGYALGEEAGSKFGQSAGTALGSAYGAAYAAEIVGAFVASLSAIIEGLRRTPGVNQSLSDAADAYEDSQLRKSIANDRAQEQSRLRTQPASAGAQAYTGPNHSQLSKDDTAHPLFYLSRGLSRVAGVALAKAMARVWATPRDQRSLDEIDALIDLYISHPSYRDWWRETLKNQIAGKAYSSPKE